ncbi:periplasmic thioredoxin of cytochrome c-type biogenesis [Psychromonas ingrahamii 37]|uniref:Periplasmic thioredoxin of cytochrome c-type biogenesis n=1 Tax=Psychromonas ingrahamii (strain DSM 17664 / CCUG 51855 / 37) TaxID=357804 RepID=A1STZ2_PSYIN|nr:thioredoxin [Psychromonas ingrahamii]ABM02957.1 periplasmic thioredoxin of cytochrome c-type biogenesis [Psychromonas ingrahamii 37]
MIKNIDLTIDITKAEQLLSGSDAFILNIVALWCSDCTAQAENLPAFAQLLSDQGMPVYQLNVQNIKDQYLSAQHKALTIKLGGRGYPRTVLMLGNKIVDSDNIEIISAEQLATLANKFTLLLSNSQCIKDSL